MIDSPPTQSAFTMFGARDILSKSGNAIPIIQQLSAIENAIDTSPGIVFDLARAIVESTCKTILNERGIDGRKLGMSDLLRRTL